MAQYIVKQSIYTDGQTVVTGRYITHDDKQRTIEYIGTESEGNSLIQRLKNNGSEFQHVRIMER